MPGNCIKRNQTVLGSDHAKTLAGEIEHQRAAQRWVIFHKENCCFVTAV